MKILIVGPSWVGDMVMAQSLFRALEKRHSEAGTEIAIDVLAPAWSRPLLERMPEVRAAIDLPFAHGELKLRQRYRLGQSLRKAGYDQAIVLPNSLKSALIPAFARIPLRTGWRGEMRYGLLNDCRLLDREAMPLMVQRFVALAGEAADPVSALKPALRPCLTTDADSARETMAALGLDAGSGGPEGAAPQVLALCPGAEFGESKQWPARHFATLANDFIARGWQIWLIGSQKDDEIARAILQRLTADHRPQCRNLAGATSLAQALDLLSQATAVVSNDSGLMHVAAALQRPVVAVYGSTSPDFTPPLADQVVTLSTGISCQPCFRRSCPLGHLLCLNELSVDMVRGGLSRVLADDLQVRGG